MGRSTLVPGPWPGLGSKPELRGCIEELERRGLLPVGHLAVLCVGSVARGWANSRSDYDFAVVSRSPWRAERSRTIPVPLHPDGVPVNVVDVGGRRWEIKHWTDAQVDQMLRKVTWSAFEAADGEARRLVEAEELFLERLSTCLALSGTSWMRRQRQALADSAFRAMVTTRSLAAADEAVEDALGQLSARDTESAVLSARKAFGHTVDALLESLNCYGSSIPKWRARRFREARPAPMSFDEYWAIETMRDFSPEDPERWVTQVVSQCCELAIEVEIQ